MSEQQPAMPRALTIAGSDSGGGAGIQADLKTFAALGVYGLSAITAITAQNTLGVSGVQDISIAIIEAQIDAVVEDIGTDATKTGMLSSPEIIEAVAGRVKKWHLRLVVDPVMVAKGGASLLSPEAVATLRSTLLPLAEIVTPNLPEAEVLTGQHIETLDEMQAAARAIHALGPRSVVVKGGHRATDPVDVYFDGIHCIELREATYSNTTYTWDRLHVFGSHYRATGTRLDSRRGRRTCQTLCNRSHTPCSRHWAWSRSHQPFLALGTGPTDGRRIIRNSQEMKP